MADRIQQRRDTRARWEEFNPLLLEGEVGYVTDDPNLYKIGDGINRWNSLPYRGFDGTITQETGNSENAVMSQKAVSEKLSELGSEANRSTSALFKNIASSMGERFIDIAVSYERDDKIEFKIIDGDSRILAIISDNIDYNDRVMISLTKDVVRYNVKKPIRYIRFYNEDGEGIPFSVEYGLYRNYPEIKKEISYASARVGVSDTVTIAEGEDRSITHDIKVSVGDVIDYELTDSENSPIRVFLLYGENEENIEVKSSPIIVDSNIYNRLRFYKTINVTSNISYKFRIYTSKEWESSKPPLYEQIFSEENYTFNNANGGYDILMNPKKGDIVFWQYSNPKGVKLDAYLTYGDTPVLLDDRENGFFEVDRDDYNKFNFFNKTNVENVCKLEVFVKTKESLEDNLYGNGLSGVYEIPAASNVSNIYIPVWVEEGGTLSWEITSNESNFLIFLHKTEDEYIELGSENNGVVVVDSNEYKFINIYSKKKGITFNYKIYATRPGVGKIFSTSDINDSTYIGAMNKVITALLQVKPTALFCFVGYYSKSEGIDNRLGKKVYGKDIVAIQTMLAEYWDAKLIRMDEFGISWRNDTNTALAWMTDGVHVANYKNWDVVGGKPQYTLVNMMARRLASELKPYFADWSNKKILWLGTSIPAGSHHEEDRNAQYPMMVADILGCACDNKSVPSSFVRLTRDDGSAIPNSDTLSLLSPNATTYYMRDIVAKADEYDIIVFDHGRNDGSWAINDYNADVWFKK